MARVSSVTTPEPLRFEIRVKPRGGANRVGGSGGNQQALLVEVQAAAVDGRANQAVEKLLARTFGITRSAINIVRGHKSRSKLIELTEPPPGAQAKLQELLAAGR